MISLGDIRPASGRPAGAYQRRLPLRYKRLAEIINLAENLDDPIQHHRLRHSATAAYLKKPFSHNPLIARKLLIRVTLTLYRLCTASHSVLLLRAILATTAPTRASRTRCQTPALLRGLIF